MVSSTNPEGKLTNSDLDLAALVLHEVTHLTAVPKAHLSSPRSRSGNITTILWSTHEASTIYTVVVDLLSIHAIHSRQLSLNPSVFFHPGQENCIADDASCLFDISGTSFLSHMSVVYSHPLSLW